ncbi:MAG: sigma-70 family RNA polymerase sigma factor [Planctomycetaceae bacterium]|nr:sigma-70 family RNA polymerase sigma factor [Planctomycetaceae bacterium]
MESGAAVPGGEAVRVLVENHRAFLRFLERRVGSRETAEDLLQEAFGRALPKVATIRKSESAVAWFYRVLRNAIIDHRRRRAAGDRALEAFARELEDPAEGSETLEEVCACVGRLAGTLKPEYAEALQRIEVEGMAVKDIAALFGDSPAAMAMRLTRALRTLRERLP